VALTLLALLSARICCASSRCQPDQRGIQSSGPMIFSSSVNIRAFESTMPASNRSLSNGKCNSWRTCARWVGLFGSSMSLMPSRRATGPACSRPCHSRRICRLRRQDAGANVGATDDPEGEAQDVQSNRWVLIPAVIRKAKRPLGGRFAFLAERESVNLESSRVQTSSIEWLNHAIYSAYVSKLAHRDPDESSVYSWVRSWVAYGSRI
jgi:hypothetical protein